MSTSHLSGAMTLSPSGRHAAARQAPDDSPWFGYVTAETLTIRSGRAAVFYEIGRVTEGDIVEVRAEANDWATISIPDHITGFVAVKDVLVDPAGSSAKTIARTKVLYPNEDDPIKSWRGFLIDGDLQLEVIDRVNTDRGAYLRVAMPSPGEAYVSARFLRRATDEEIAEWQKRRQQQSSKAGDSEETPGPSPNADEAASEEYKGSAAATGQAATPAEPEVDRAGADDRPPGVILPVGEPVLTPRPGGLEAAGAAQLKADAGADGGQPEEAVAPSGTEGETSLPSQKKTPLAPLTNNLQWQADPLGQPDQTTALDAIGTEASEAHAPLSSAPAIETLESLYDSVRDMPILDAEIEPLLEQYAQVSADQNADPTDRRLAALRVSLLRIRLRHQEAQRRLQSALDTAASGEESMRRLAADQRAADTDYAAVGRLTVSSLFDGRRLPKLWRLRNPITGRTVAYLLPPGPGSEINLEMMHNRLVGVKGAPGPRVAGPVRTLYVERADLLDNPR